MVSRVGKLPIKVADDVKVNIDNSVITFTKGNKTKTYDFGNKVNVSFKDKEIIVEENDDVIVIEKKLKELFDVNDWGRVHHLLIFFGRYLCTAQKPDCNRCPFIKQCTKK
jgi:adenine-specific DNA glycosylase